MTPLAYSGHVSKGFKINHAAIRQMAAEIQAGFDRHAITVPITGRMGGALEVSEVELWESLLVQALYRRGAVGVNSAVPPTELDVDLTSVQVEQALQLARDDGLIESASLAGDVHLTALGRSAARAPASASLPANLVHNDFSGATFTGSNVSTASHASQTVNGHAVDVVALAELVRLIDEVVDRSALNAEQIEELEADLEVFEMQENEPSVRRKGLKRALHSVEQLAIASVGGAAATGITQLVSTLA